jgi:hypothetical protein
MQKARRRLQKGRRRAQRLGGPAVFFFGALKHARKTHTKAQAS